MKKKDFCKAVEFGSALAMCVSASCMANSLLPNTKSRLIRILHPIGFALMISPVIYKSSRYWAQLAEQTYDSLSEEETTDKEKTDG